MKGNSSCSVQGSAEPTVKVFLSSLRLSVFAQWPGASARLRSVDGVQWERWMKDCGCQALPSVWFFCLYLQSKINL